MQVIQDTCQLILLLALFFILAYLIEKKNKNLIIIFMLVAFLSTNVISYLNPVPNKQVIISDEIVQTGKFLQTKIKDSERVYVIYQNTDGYEFNLLRFQIAPIRTNLLWNGVLVNHTVKLTILLIISVKIIGRKN